MAAGAITILDSSGNPQDVLTEVIGGDNAEANVIYANGVIVSTAAPLPITATTLTTIAGAVSGTEMQVDVLTLPSVTLTQPSTGTTTSVNDAASTTSLLASNANRRAYSVYNESEYALYLKHGATASLTSYKVKIEPYGYWDYDGYTGAVDGIWAANGTGAARITEET